MPKKAVEFLQILGTEVVGSGALPSHYEVERGSFIRGSPACSGDAAKAEFRLRPARASGSMAGRHPRRSRHAYRRTLSSRARRLISFNSCATPREIHFIPRLFSTE